MNHAGQAMGEPINIGLDFGSLGCRAAYVPGDEALPLPATERWSAPEQWLTCEREPSSVLGVQFPSLKNLLGMETPKPGDAVTAPVATVRGMLVDLRRVTEELTGRPPGQLVIAVPALYSSARRTALREIALSTGFADVHLLNDGMAAVIMHLRRSQ